MKRESETSPITTQLPPRPGTNIDYDLFLDCVHCGLCTAACPTYVETGDENDSPRGRIYLMRAVADGRIELSPEVRRHLELCLDCRACESACPSGVQYGRLIEPFRVAMGQALATAPTALSPKTHDWFHRWVLYRVFPYPRRMRWALMPARMAQRLRVDRLLKRMGLWRFLPGRFRQLQSMLPPPSPRLPALPEYLPAQGSFRAKVALFTGCVADALFRQTHWATARVLQANGCDVHVPRDQVCCGAIHYHSGVAEPALEFVRQNCTAFNPDDYDAIIINVAGCGSMMKDYSHIVAECVQSGGGTAHQSPIDDTGGRCASVSEPRRRRRGSVWSASRLAEAAEINPATLLESAERFAGKVRDVSEFLAELGPVPPEGEIRLRATYHDACHLAHAQQVRDQPRRLLGMIPGLELVPLEESELCCGAAGTYNLTEPEMSARLSARKLANIRATGARAVFTGNAGCILQISKEAREENVPLWVAHPIEALDLSYRRQPPPV